MATITHVKVSAIADDAASVAAGEVVPSDWNASHTVTGLQVTSEKGAASGYASLDAGGTVPVAQIPTAADQALAPTGAYESAPRRNAAMTTATIPASGTLYLVACYIPTGFSVGNITFVSSGTAAVTPTNWWFGLYNSSRVQLAVTANQLTAVYGTYTVHTRAIATIASGAASAFVTTYSGLHYIGWMMTAATVASNFGGTVGGSSAGIVPILAGTSSTALTIPPAFPFTAAAIGSDGGVHPYAYVTP